MRNFKIFLLAICFLIGGTSLVYATTQDGSVTVTVNPATTGTLTGSPSSCTIASGASSCNVTLMWTATNLDGTLAITSNYPSANTTLAVLSIYSNFSIIAVPFLSSPRTLYLYSNAILLAQTIATSSCAINTTWNGSVCALNTYTVSTSAGPGGSITPASRTGVIHGSTTTFTVAPNPGYSIGSVLGCSGSLSGNTYTTGPIIAACTVTATFGDATPPSAPGILTTSWIGDHYVNTNFVASTTGSTDTGSGIRGYKLCRSYDNGGGCQVWTTNGEHATKSETVSGADLPSPGTYRYYYWYAYDNSGNQSTNSPAEYVRMDAISPVYNSTSFTGCNYESGNNCYVKNGTTFYVNISHTDNESGSNNQYFELSKNGANRGTWDGLTGNIKSYAVPYGVNNGGYYTSYGEGVGMDGAGYLNIQNAQCIQTGNCNVTALGKWPVVAGSGASTVYGVTVYMYDQFYNGVGYTATSKYVYLDNDAPSTPTPTDDGVNVASPTLNFYASPSDASSGLSVCYAQIDVNNTDGAGLAMGTTAIGATGNYSWTGLAGNTYYYRYYCTDRVGNSSGWSSWSDGVSINAIPTVTTSPVTSITQTTATGGGNTVSNGGSPVTQAGLVWHVSANPTTSLYTGITFNGWAIGGPWTSGMTGLTTNTTYHVRAYATNSVGTSYGPDVLFTTIGVTSGTLTASGCTIPENGNSCPSTLTWTDTTNPVGVSTIRTPDATGSTVVTPATVAGTTTSTVPYPSRTFVLVNNGNPNPLDTATAIASCNTSINHWDPAPPEPNTTPRCVVNTPTNTFTVNNATTATIFKGKSATLRWNSPLSISCTGIGFDTGGVKTNLDPGVTVSPLVTTTYTLVCTNGTGSGSNNVITKVINLNIKEN